MSSAEPRFEDVLQILDSLVAATDTNIPNAPHAAFWRGIGRDDFVAFQTDQWGVPGSLVTPGNCDTSVLYQALAGLPPFDGSELPRMPDTSADPDACAASADHLAVIETWINSGAP